MAGHTLFAAALVAPLDRADAHTLMEALLRGALSPGEIAALLTALHHRGVTAAELAGFAEAMRAASTTLPLTPAERDTLVDTCGTGGDGGHTFNISTAVALVAAAAGAHVAKHGNRKVTSACGSADVLEALGVPIEHTPEQAAEALRRHGFAFLLATQMHPGMRAVAPVRRTLPFRTVFNLLGPMANPAGARRQILGVYASELVPLVAEALALTGHMHHVLVVHGHGGLDELSLSGPSIVAQVKGSAVTQFTLHPEEVGLATSSDSLQGGEASKNATILRGVFAGQPGAARDVVLLNAAAVLFVAGLVLNLREGVDLAANAIDKGLVSNLVLTLGHVANL